MPPIEGPSRNATVEMPQSKCHSRNATVEMPQSTGHMGSIGGSAAGGAIGDQHLKYCWDIDFESIGNRQTQREKETAIAANDLSWPRANRASDRAPRIARPNSKGPARKPRLEAAGSKARHCGPGSRPEIGPTALKKPWPATGRPPGDLSRFARSAAVNGLGRARSDRPRRRKRVWCSAVDPCRL